MSHFCWLLTLLAGGVSSLSVLPLIGLVSGGFIALPFIARIVFVTAAPLLLTQPDPGMVTPVVIKLRLRDLTHTGDIAGKIHAIST